MKDEACSRAETKRHRRRQWVGYFFFTMFLVFVIFQIWLLRRAMSANFYEPQIVYSEMIPDRAEYTAGEVVHFTFTRTTTEKEGYPLLLLICDGFENQDTGEVFAGIIAPRVINKEGVETIHATRQIPAFATSGVYHFEGWSSSQTGRPNRAIYYASRKFNIKAKP